MSSVHSGSERVCIFVIKKFWTRSRGYVDVYVYLPNEWTDGRRCDFTSIVKFMEIALPIKLLFAVRLIMFAKRLNNCTSFSAIWRADVEKDLI